MIDRPIDSIIIHCSDSKFGNSIKIDEWHKNRGWEGIGYHYVICNGFTNNSEDYNSFMDGVIESGRALEKPGAHCYGHNATSIGVCLIGKSGLFTPSQYQSLVDVIKVHRETYMGINVYMHSDLNENKPHCPGIATTDLLDILTGGSNDQ